MEPNPLKLQAHFQPIIRTILGSSLISLAASHLQKINVLGVYLGISNELNMASWGNLENLKYQIFEFNVDKILSSFYSLT